MDCLAQGEQGIEGSCERAEELALHGPGVKCSCAGRWIPGTRQLSNQLTCGLTRRCSRREPRHHCRRFILSCGRFARLSAGPLESNGNFKGGHNANDSLGNDCDTWTAAYRLCGHQYRPTQKARQALAPTGKLRVGLQLGNPLNVMRDSASEQRKRG